MTVVTMSWAKFHKLLSLSIYKNNHAHRRKFACVPVSACRQTQMSLVILPAQPQDTVFFSFPLSLSCRRSRRILFSSRFLFLTLPLAAAGSLPCRFRRQGIVFFVFLSSSSSSSSSGNTSTANNFNIS